MNVLKNRHERADINIMNPFDRKLKDLGHYPLTAKDLSTLQVNMGYKCNLRCTHCHVTASPVRNEEMSLQTVNIIIDIVRRHDEIKTVDITGGSPEYNPNYRRLITAVSDLGKTIIVRTNLAIYSEEGLADIPEFLAENKVKIVASLPCYTREGVDSQRGNGTYDKAIAALKRLNEPGYGQDGSGLEIDLMFNPAKEGIAPDQKMLENAYMGKLKEMHGIVFNHLIALSNMPIGRLGKALTDKEKRDYLYQLEEQFNPSTIENIMCRHLISVSPEGKIYDCDFWQMINLPVKNGSSRIEDFDFSRLKNREIITLPMCLMCAAGAGASCGGALS